MQFSIKNLIAASAVLGFFFAFYSKFGVGGAIFGTLLLLASVVLIVRVVRQWGNATIIKRGWMIFSASFVTLLLLGAVSQLLFGELSDELLAKKLQNTCSRIEDFKDIDVQYYYGKGTSIAITGSVADLESAKRLQEMIGATVVGKCRCFFSLDVEIVSSGEHWHFLGDGQPWIRTKLFADSLSGK